MNKKVLMEQIESLVKDDEISQETIIRQSQEIDRLNNIINELYEFVEWHYKDNQEAFKNSGIGLTYPEVDYVLDKLKELKENNK